MSKKVAVRGQVNILCLFIWRMHHISDGVYLISIATCNVSYQLHSTADIIIISFI